MMKLKCKKCNRVVFDNHAKGCMFLVDEKECPFCNPKENKKEGDEK